MLPTDIPKIYNPANQTKQELVENFGVRTDLFKEIFDDIKNSNMTVPRQHYIIQGVRGQGKTTLLLRLKYEILNDAKLRQRLIPIMFNEEQYNISRLFKLWETTAEYLDQFDETQSLAEKMQQFENEQDYENKCFNVLENELKRQQRKLILFIDNIDAMLNKFTRKEHCRLREIFTESAELRIIGASSYSLESHYDYSEPFYQFFKMPQLRGLDTKDTKTLLCKLGERYKKARVKEIVKTQPGRVEALRRLTGGVIRTIILHYQIFVDDNEGNAFTDLEKILDSVTPLYKHRMDSLSPQQQEIIDCIALHWDAISTREIAAKTKLSSKAVSAQLKQLGKYHIIEKVETDTKNLLYRISERFFNIWYLMRHGRKWDEKRVRFLVEFLQIWCDEKELQNRAQKHLQAIYTKKMHETYALYWSEALARTPIDRQLQHQLVQETKSYLKDKKSDFYDAKSRSDLQLSKDAQKAFDSGNLPDTITFDEIKFKNPQEKTTLAISWLLLGKQKKEAKNLLLEAVEDNETAAIYTLALLYQTEIKDIAKAEKYYSMAVEKGNTDAMHNLAWLYFQLKKRKNDALSLSEHAYSERKNSVTAHTRSSILIWHNQIQRAMSIAEQFLQDELFLNQFPNGISTFLMLLLAKKQYHSVLSIFNENPYNLKDRFKPLYYATLFLLKNEHPNEYKKMGGELEETVTEIIEEIKKFEKDYA